MASRALLTHRLHGARRGHPWGIEEVAPGVPVVGGSSSDHSPDGKFQQFANGHAVHGPLRHRRHSSGPIGYAFSNGYRLTGKKATVTRASGRTVFELDGRRAMDVYSEWVGDPRSEIGGGALLSFSVQYPLLFHKDGITYSAHPINSNPDGSMDFGAAMSPGMVLELGENTVNGLIAEAGNAVTRRPWASASRRPSCSPIAAAAPSPSVTGSGRSPASSSTPSATCPGSATWRSASRAARWPGSPPMPT